MTDLRRAQGYPREWQVPSRNRPDSNQPGGLMDPTPTLMGQYARAIREYNPDPVYNPESDMNYEESNQPYERVE